MKFFLAATLLASAAAFAPVQPQQSVKTSSSSALNFELTEGGYLGAQPPLGVFDPLGLLNAQARTICQLAFLGQIVTRNGIHLPRDIDYSGHSFDSYPNGIAALFGPDAIPSAGLAQMVAFIGLLELVVMKDSANGAALGEFVGDFRNGALDFGWDTFNEETKLSKRAIELNNGRAAMMGILGLMVHEKLGEIGMAVELPIIGTLS